MAPKYFLRNLQNFAAPQWLLTNTRAKIDAHLQDRLPAFRPLNRTANFWIVLRFHNSFFVKDFSKALSAATNDPIASAILGMAFNDSDQQSPHFGVAWSVQKPKGLAYLTTKLSQLIRNADGRR